MLDPRQGVPQGDGDAGAEAVLAKGVVTVSDNLPMNRPMLRDSNEKARWPANAGTQFGLDVVEHSTKAAWQLQLPLHYTNVGSAIVKGSPPKFYYFFF